MGKYGTESKIRTIHKKMLLNFKKQFKFCVKPRNTKPRKYISKLYTDEYIKLFEYRKCLIHCRVCKKWSKAYLGYRIKCKECLRDDRQIRTGLCTDWNIWGDRVATD